MASRPRKLRYQPNSMADPELRSPSISARKAANSRRTLLKSVQHSSKQSRKQRPRSLADASSSERSRPQIQKILRASLQKWQIQKQKQQRQHRRQQKQKDRKSRSLKRFNKEVREYNREHFRTEPLEQPPWGVDQQRLKNYAKRMFEQMKRMSGSADRRELSRRGQSRARPINPQMGDGRSLRSEYFLQTSRNKQAPSNSSKKKRKQQPKRRQPTLIAR